MSARALFVIGLVTAALPVNAGLGAREAGPVPQAPCASFDATVVSTADLRCMELLPTRAAGDARGVVELGRVRTPFGVAVTPDGVHRYEITVVLEGLADETAHGAVEYVAWATTPVLDPVVRLGRVDNGVNRLGEVAFNQFLILVSAETQAGVGERRGPLLLRGGSPSTRMHPEDLITRSPMALVPGAGAEATASGASSPGVHADAHGAVATGEWGMPPMHPGVRSVPGMMDVRPDVGPYLPGVPDPAALDLGRPRQLVRLADGDALELEARFVRRVIGSRTFVMLGFNGQLPGPLVHVPQGARIEVEFHNATDLPLTIHWHGVRLENRFDGVPGLTQEPVAPGASFRYEIVFPDAGIYWYHPHHREDVAQDLGLYGNLLVEPASEDAYGPVHREEVVMLDDLLVAEHGLVPYGDEAPNFALMGRFGNVFLTNGEPDYGLDVRTGEVVRFFFTNASSTRTFNLTFRLPGAGDGGDAGVRRLPIKVIGTDVGRFERQEWARSVVIAPAERYVVEVRFPEAGEVVFANEVQAIDHLAGGFFAEVSALGAVRVAPETADPDLAAAFSRLRSHPDVVAEIDAYRPEFDRPPDHELLLELEVEELPLVIDQVMSLDAVYFNPVEWSGTMPMMNWASTGRRVAWHLVDAASGKVDEEIDDWRFRIGDVVKIRIRNERHSFHAMQHPIHFHGQRFLVLEQDGVVNDNLAWKDTFLAPVGSTTDLLLELSNPGKWMAHCHIAEHLSSGMKMVFEVQE